MKTKKNLISIFLMLSMYSCYSQTLAKYKKEMDSLSVKYKVKVCGYTKTIVDDRESFIIFYRTPSLDMQEKLAWTRKINKK